MLTRTLLHVFAALVFMISAVQRAQASDWPTRPIRIVVPYAVGGGTDLLARMVGPKLSAALKQPLVIENRTGAGGAIGVESVTKSAPDGYTILFDSPSLVVNPLIAKTPYEGKDLLPVAQLISQPFIIAAHPKVPAKNLKELVAWSHTQPKGMNAGVPGGASALAAEFFKLISNANMDLIPYKGGGAVMAATVAGEVDICFVDVASVASQVVAGKLNGLAVTGKRRLPIVPGVPTSAEAGMPEYSVGLWLGVFLPAGTPGDIVRILHKEVSIAMSDPVIIERVSQLGGEAVQTSQTEFSQFYRSEIERWKDIVVRAKVKVDR
jgi:tripartite-type tricarboxylate transporter receptor subunit TctC